MLPQSANHKNPRGPFIKICDARSPSRVRRSESGSIVTLPLTA